MRTRKSFLHGPSQEGNKGASLFLSALRRKIYLPRPTCVACSRQVLTLGIAQRTAVVGECLTVVPEEKSCPHDDTGCLSPRKPVTVVKMSLAFAGEFRWRGRPSPLQRRESGAPAQGEVLPGAGHRPRAPDLLGFHPQGETPILAHHAQLIAFTSISAHHCFFYCRITVKVTNERSDLHHSVDHHDNVIRQSLRSQYSVAKFLKIS